MHSGPKLFIFASFTCLHHLCTSLHTHKNLQLHFALMTSTKTHVFLTILFLTYSVRRATKSVQNISTSVRHLKSIIRGDRNRLSAVMDKKGPADMQKIRGCWQHLSFQTSFSFFFFLYDSVLFHSKTTSVIFKLS